MDAPREENRTLIVVDDEPETLKGYLDFLSAKSADSSARKSSRTKAEGAPAARGLQPGESFRVLQAATGEAAIDLVRSELAAGRRVAAGFFDVKLGPGLDGLATIRAIRELDRDIHFAVVTAYQDRTVDEIQDLFGEECKDQWDYLNKPFSQGEILQKARQMVAAWNRRVELEQLQRGLVQSERMAAIGQVARGIGHEFGNILLRVMGKTDLALREQDPAKIHEHLKTVMRASERAAVIVRNLQSFSKAEPSLKRGRVDAAVEEALGLISHEYAKSGIQLIRDVKPTPEVQLDSGALIQVFLNLLVNAIHAMASGDGQAKMTVSVGSMPDPSPLRLGDGVFISFRDTGTGIAPEHLSRIFDFAFTTKGNSGSGLGLSVSRGIVEAHGGSLTVQTEVGKGTQFTVWLPKERHHG